MSKIIDAVSIVMTCQDEIFAIQRQYFLKAFPGYWAFPGGKVEAEDDQFFIDHPVTKKLDQKLFGAAVREGQEELGIDLREEILAGRVESVDYLGLATTPDFNPYRFATYFFKVNFKEKVDFVIDRNEARIAVWMRCAELLSQFNRGHVLAVPPVVQVIETLGKDPGTTFIEDLNFSFDGTQFVPMIESLRSVRQFMPLSHTLPPATRTNAFLIGDGIHPKILIDPSPIDENEYQKFKNTLKPFGVDKILLTHHHPDHYERSNQLALDLKVPMLMSADTHQRILKLRSGYFDGVETILIKEGDVVTHWLDREVKVFEVPGHDEGQLALAASDMSWFIAGDLFQGIGTVVIGGEEGDMTKYFNTLQKVINLSPRVLFPSHGIGLGGTAVLEKTLEHRKMRESQVMELHLKGMKPEEMLAKLYADVNKELWPYALENILKHLQKLRAENSIN